jgi:phage recombination protein Bet
MSDNGKALIQISAQAPLDYQSSDVLRTLKETVAKGATDAEFRIFLEHCKGTKLNPFKREVWFVKTNQGVQIMTGINGFYAIANSNPAFDGIESECIADERGQLLKAVAKVWRKDRSRPTVAEAYFAEYGKPYGNWKTMPRVMLIKCAESMAIRKAFPQELNGLYSEEEMPREFSCKLEAPTMGGQLAKPEAGTWSYCISNAPEENLAGILDYIEKNKDALLEHIPEYDVYVFSKNMSKLQRYKLSSKELAEARSLASALPESQEIPDAIAQAFPGSTIEQQDLV